MGNDMPSLFIATPSYMGQVTVDYCRSYADTVKQMSDQGWRVDAELRRSSTLLATERNILFEQFWQSHCDFMLCVDADMSWRPQAVTDLALHDLDIATAAYPSRHTGTRVHEETQPREHRQGLIKVQYTGLGFMLLQRRAIEKMRNHYPELYYSQTNLGRFYKQGYAFCDTEVWQGRHWGEDYVFCRRARNAGIDIWLDPQIKIQHMGMSL